MTPTEQAQAFVQMMLCGAYMGVIYDLLGMLRRVRGLCALTDMLFGSCCAAGIIWTALRLEIEAFRLYAFTGVACGLALYGSTVGMGIRKIAADVRRKRAERKEKYKKKPYAAGD